MLSAGPARNAEILPLLRSSRYAFFISNQAGDVLLISRGAINLFGLKDSSAASSCDTIFKTESAKVLVQLQQSLTGSGTREIYTLRRGEIRPEKSLWMEGIPLSEEYVLFFAGSLSSITRRGTNQEADEALFFGSLVPMAMSSPEGTVLQANQAFLDLWGFSSESEVIGRKTSEFWFDVNKADAVLKSTVNRGKWLGDLTGIKKDGSRFHVEVSVSLVRDPEGKAICVVASFLDRSIESASMQALIFHNRLLGSVQEAIIATDLLGTILYWGNGAQRLFGYTEEEVLGKFIGDLMSPDNPSRSYDRVNVAHSTGRWEGRCRKPRKDGSLLWSDTIIYLVHDENGNPSGFVGIERDVSTEVTYQESLKKALRELEIIHSTEKSLLSETESAGVARVALKKIVKTVGCLRATITLINNDGQSARIVAAYPEDPEIGFPWAAEIPLYIFGDETMKHNPEVNFVEDISCINRGEDIHKSLIDKGISSYANIPLTTGEDIIGFINLGFRGTGTIEKDAVAFTRALAPTIALVIQRVTDAEREHENAIRIRKLRQRAEYSAARERTRISRMLHDYMGQDLTLANLDIALLRKSMESGNKNKDIESLIDKLEQRLGQIGYRTREVLQELNSRGMAHNSIFESLQEYCGNLKHCSEMEIHFRKHEDGTFPLGEEQQREIESAAIEAINNAVKHSHARSIEVSVQSTEKMLEITIMDNGTGFPLKIDGQKSRYAGWGIQYIREHLEAIGGSATLCTRPENGTHWVLKLGKKDR